MSSNNPIIKNLLKDIEVSDAHKSSHWKHYLKDFQFSDNTGVTGISGFGNRSKLSTLSQIFHLVGLNVMRRRSHQHSDVIKIETLVKDTCDKQARAYDYDAWRHANTFAFLKKHTSETNIVNACVIGDGQTNFSSNFFKIFSSSKILISVNLPEVLLSDYLLMKDSLDKNIVIEYLTRDTDFEKLLNSNQKYVLLCTPTNFEYVKKLKVDLFANIASMQEMNSNSVTQYFEGMRQNPGSRYFYCANRKLKKLPDGEISDFSKYGWSAKDEVLVKTSPIPWHQEFYQTRPPFIRKFDGEHLHTLVKLASTR